jgi:hypothetical protein
MMRDFLALLKILLRHKIAASFLLGIVIWGCHISGGEKLVGVEVSPDYFYRLEYYEPRRYQRDFFNRTLRLYSNLPGNRFFGEMGPYLLHGEISWDMNIDNTVYAAGADIFKQVPSIDPVTQQIRNPEGRNYAVDSSQTCLVGEDRFLRSWHGCSFSPPPHPQCDESLPENRMKQCRIEAARNYDIAYRKALFDMNHHTCEPVEAALLRHAGQRVERDMAFFYKAFGCGPYKRDDIDEIVQRFNHG